MTKKELINKVLADIVEKYNPPTLPLFTEILKSEYNQAIDDAIKIITDMQGWVVDDGDERFLATHKESSILKLQALKKINHDTKTNILFSKQGNSQ